MFSYEIVIIIVTPTGIKGTHSFGTQGKFWGLRII